MNIDLNKLAPKKIRENTLDKAIFMTMMVLFKSKSPVAPAKQQVR